MTRCSRPETSHLYRWIALWAAAAGGCVSTSGPGGGAAVASHEEAPVTGLPSLDQPAFAERAELFRADKASHDADPESFFALPGGNCTLPDELLHDLVYGMSRDDYLDEHTSKVRGVSGETTLTSLSWGLREGECEDGALDGSVELIAHHGRVEQQTTFGQRSVIEHEVQTRVRATVEDGALAQTHARHERTRTVITQSDGSTQDLHRGWLVTFAYPSGVDDLPALSVSFHGSRPSSWTTWTREAVQPGIERRNKYLGPYLEMISHWSDAGPHGQSIVYDRSGREVNRFCHVDGEEFLTDGPCPVSF